MNDRRFLDSRSGRIRRASAVVYAVATGVAVAVWIVSGGSDAVGRSDWIAAAWLGTTAVAAWWIVAGIGLRIVRRFDRTSG